MKRGRLIRIITAAALLPLFVTCSFETDGKFAGLVAGYERKQPPEPGLQPPLNVRVTANASGGIQITWDDSADADGYTIYRASAEKPARFVRRGSSANNLYTDSGASVPPDTPFYYQLTAYNSAEVSVPSTTAGPVSALLYQNSAILPKPEIISAAVSANSATITWTAVSGAMGYLLYRASLYDGDVYIFRISTHTTSYTDENLARGSYFYQVRAFDFNNAEGYISSPEGPVDITTGAILPPAPAKPQNLRAVASYQSQLPVIALSWNAAANATVYYVYRSVDDDYYEKIGESSSTAYQDTEIMNGEAYYYRVRGYNGPQEGYLSDSYGPVLLLPGKPEIAAAVSDNTVTVSWGAVHGADIYYVHRSADNSPFQLLTARGTGNTSFIDAALAYGAYYYRVEAANSAGRGFPSESIQAIVANDAQTPVISVDPTGDTYIRNIPATALTVQASVSDGGALSYQWYSNNTNSNSGGTLVSGAQGASYLPPTNTAGTVYYYVIVTNTNNSVNGNKTATAASNVAAIVVMGPTSAQGDIVIDLTAVDEWETLEQTAQATAGVDTEFTVPETYAEYRWYLDGEPAGTASAYTFNQPAGVYELAVVVRNAAGEGRSGKCRVTVIEIESEIYALPVSDAAEFNAALSAIQGNSQDSDFIITVTADISLDPQDLTLAAYANKSITLRGDTPARTISLSSQGSLFTVGADVELVLEDIVLVGRSDNNTSLVKVNTDGTLVVNSGGKVTGNTYSTSVNESGGAGVYVNGGTLEIAGGEIGGNTVNGTIRGGVRGGGVYALNDSDVLMTGGAIRDNLVTNVASGEIIGAGGGGIFVYNNSRFEMTGGIIEGNTVNSRSTNLLAAAEGGGVHIRGNSSFYFKGGTIRKNICNASGNNYCFADGGGVCIIDGINFVMSGGIISGNSVTSSANPNYTYSTNPTYSVGAQGGGVRCGLPESFVKTGGIIYGNDVTGNDADGIPLKNTAQSNSSGLGGGHAVFYNINLGNTNPRRNTTAYENHTMDSNVSGSAGGWE